MVKRKGNLISSLCRMDNILLADTNARKAKRRSRRFIEKHDKNIIEEDRALARSFSDLSYKTSPYVTYKIYEPKERLIYRLPYYPDRIAHHAIMNVVKEHWTKQFITNTYSCIEHRGIHKCLKDLKRDLRKTRGNNETQYCLKLDITKFYPSIDHNILKSIISRKIKDTKVLEILYEIIDSVNGINGIYGKGVPIGNYLSQYFANLYLTGFDHWCKEELKCRYYYRYADDIVILGESKAHLRNVLVAIKLYLKHVLKLGVKGNYQIFPVESRGIDFVGYAFRHDYIRVRKGIKNSCRKRIRHSNNLAGILPSYFGWFQHCNAVNLKRTILDEVRKIENK